MSALRFSSLSTLCPLGAVIFSSPAAFGELFTLAGDSLPDANVIEGSNSGTNAASLTTSGMGSGTSWVAEDGFIKMNTAPSREIWFGTSDQGYGDNSDFSLSGNAVGNRISVTFLLTPGSQSWGFYFWDQDGYLANVGVNQTDNGQTRDGVWITFEGNAYEIGGDDFDTTVLHTYEAHVFDTQVTYFLDGTMVGTGLSQKTDTLGVFGLSVIGDGSGTTPTGTGSMWIDSLVIDNAAGAPVIPEPRHLPLLTGTFILLGLFWRRR